MIPSYGSFRNNPPADVVTVVSTAPSPVYQPGSAYEMYVQFVNRVGKSALTYVSTVYSDRINVTINDGVIKTTEEVFWVAISVSKTTSEEDAYIVYQYRVRDADQYTVRPLPHTRSINIYSTTEVTVQDSSLLGQLPTTVVNAGSIAYATVENKFYRLDPSAQATPDGLISYGTIVNGIGNWTEYSGSFSAYVPNLGGIGSSDVPISMAPSSTLKLPIKSTAIESAKMRFWLNNGLSADSSVYIEEAQFTFDVKVNGTSGFNSLFANKIAYQLVGYIDRVTADIVYTPLDQSVKKWNPVDGFIRLTEPMPPNQAAVIDAWISCDNDELIGKVPFQLSEVQILILPVSDISGGKPSELAKPIGDLILKDRSKFLILPDLVRLPGIATFKDGYLADSASTQYVPGCVEDTANQKVIINGALNGFCDVRQSPVVLNHGEFVRAIISSEPGESKIAQSNTITVTNKKITISLIHPTGVRSDYPDPAIAGMEDDDIYFNPEFFVVYLKKDSIVYRCSPEYTSETSLTISSLSGIPAVASLPPDPDLYFSLFEPNSVSIASSGTGGLTGTFTAYVCYYYESPNYYVTSIRHNTLECPPTLTSSLGEAINFSLGKANNLSDLTDKAIARTNLDVHPKSVTDDHLADINNPHSVTLTQLGGASATDLTNAINSLSTLVNALDIRLTKLEKIGTKVKMIAGASYTVLQTDYRTILEFNSSSDTSVTIDSNTLLYNNPVPGVFEFWIINNDSGSISFIIQPVGDSISGTIPPNKLTRIYYRSGGFWIIG